MPRVFIGRTHDLYGKSLWELLCNLKDFGVGRVVMRTKPNRRYPERSWLKIISAQPEMDPENRRGSVTVTEVYRGVALPGERVLRRTTALTDYQLVPRREEAAFCQLSPERVAAATRVLPATVPKPVLLLELERQRASSDVRPDMPAIYRRAWYYQVEGSGEGSRA
ncbi:uncharacterized protein LOC119113888 [Pollicipes pollicipes]|uniref:uncharacterized protein LOC119113888 n=1 Tax=Pollicipes pollicipes TaxID=41117 RepID=UPI001884E205|nr:uncharacterized protein LOC119113888 [Pollicipes pollicipes]XP_037094016.1 uncharacterized protein LOC119113888 [Pollicipes pollicipes]